MKIDSSEQFLEIFGTNIRNIQNQLNYSNREFSQKYGYDRNNLSKLVIGKQDIKLSTVVYFAEKLNLPVFILFSRNFQIYLKNREKYSYVEADYTKVFIENVNKNLEKIGKKQSDLQSLSPVTISRILCGHIQDPLISTLSKIASDMHIGLSCLFELTEESELKL